MDDFYTKLQEYLQMDTEISYDEFADYYGRFLSYVNENYEQMDQETMIRGRYIFTILQANSMDRSRRKNGVAKKYKKIAEKTQFWADAIKHRLLKDGMTAAEIEQAENALHQ